MKFIYCESLQEMIDACVMLTKQGLTFIATTEQCYKIEITGGY